MDQQELIIAIEYAKTKTIEYEQQLFSINVSERAFMFHFARYLYEKVPSNLNLDCEYNRHGEEPQNFKTLIYQKYGTSSDEECKVLPDILIHQRTNDSSNVLVLEIKKLGESTIEDERRLCAFKEKPYSYDFAVMLTYGLEDEQPKIDYQFI